MVDRDNVLDTRPKAALYSTYGTKRDKRAADFLKAFCVVNGLRCTLYVDKHIPKDAQPPGWARLCEDVGAGKYDVVLTWLDVPGMEQFCAAHNARFEQIDVFEWYAATREKKFNLLR